MSTRRFSTGQVFWWQGQQYVVNRLLPENQVNIENISTTAIQIVSLDTLVSALFDDELEFVAETRSKEVTDHLLPEEQQIELSDFSEHLVEKAKFRLHMIKPLVSLRSAERTDTVIQDRIDAVKKEIINEPEKVDFLRGMSVRSVRRHIKRYLKAGQDLRALIDVYSRSGGRGKSRLISKLKNLVDTVINDLYWRKVKVTIDDLVHEVAARIEEENQLGSPTEHLRVPARSTIVRRIEALDTKQRFSAKHGSRAAKKHFEQVGKMDYPTIPLERVEIDHTVLDLIVVDEDDNLPLGRPTLTIAIDMATRYPCGFYVGFEPPSYAAVAECLYDSIRNKTDVREKYGTEHDWYPYGIPITLIIDNGRDFIGKDLDDACLLLGIILIRSPIATPEFKAGIERYFGTFNTGLAQTTDGTTFSNSVARGDLNSLKDAIVTLNEFRQMAHIYIVDIYAERFHTGLRGVPARRWEQAMEKGFHPRLPSSNEELLILLSRVEWRTVGRSGISLKRIWYNSPELPRLRKLLNGTKIKFKYHSGDLSRIHIFDPFKKVYIEVPAVDQEYTAGLSLWKHQQILDLANLEHKKVDKAALGRAKRKLQEIMDKARKRKRTQTRARTERWKQSLPSLENEQSKSLPAPSINGHHTNEILPPLDDRFLTESEQGLEGWETADIPPMPN